MAEEKKEMFMNDNNHVDFAPFRYVIDTKTLIIDQFFWENECLEETRYLFLRYCEKNHIQLQTVSNLTAEYDMKLSNSATDDFKKMWSETEWTLYNLYGYQFHAHVWEKNEYQYILNTHEIQCLRQWALVHCYGSMTMPDWEDLSPLSAFIDQKLNEYGAVFVKLSSTSAKKDHKIKPLYTKTDVFLFLIEARSFINEYEKCLNHPEQILSVVIKPFLFDITSENEYRLFVSNGQLRAISIQHCYDDNIQVKDPEKIIYQFNTFIQTNSHPYVSFIMDAYIDKNNEIHRIEYNMWSCRGKYTFDGSTCNWTAGGTSRFHSQKDNKILGLVREDKIEHNSCGIVCR